MADSLVERADPRFELASRRTGMAFHRTRMAADRTLMAVIRTSLSLIGFGFTIYQVFRQLKNTGEVAQSAAPRHFGLSLVAVGLFMLVGGIGYHVAFMYELRRQRTAMKIEGLVQARSRFPVSLTLIVALLLLVIGILAIMSMAFNMGPFE